MDPDVGGGCRSCVKLCSFFIDDLWARVPVSPTNDEHILHIINQHHCFLIANDARGTRSWCVCVCVSIILQEVSC